MSAEWSAAALWKLMEEPRNAATALAVFGRPLLVMLAQVWSCAVGRVWLVRP